MGEFSFRTTLRSLEKFGIELKHPQVLARQPYPLRKTNPPGLREPSFQRETARALRYFLVRLPFLPSCTMPRQANHSKNTCAARTVPI